MNVRWVLLSCILQLYLNPVAPQQYHYYNEAPQQYDEVNDNGDSDEFSGDQMKRSAIIRRSRFTESEECYCTCERCFGGGEKPCCDEFCRYCEPPQDMPMGNTDQYGALPPGEQKVVFVPFPYPLIVPEEITTPPLTTITKPTTITPEPTTTTPKPATTTPKPTTTTPKPTTTTPKPTITTPKPTTTTTKMTTTTRKPTTTTPKPTTKTTTRATTKTTTTAKKTTKKPSTTRKPTKPTGFRRRANDLEYDILTRHRQLMQLNPVVKRHRPTWVPKYGIVPIPDNLAAKLMTQLTEVRAMKSRNM